MRAAAAVLALALVVASAAGLASCRTPPPRDGVERGSGAAAVDAGAIAPPIDAAPARVSDEECVRLIDHTLEVGLALQRTVKPPEYVPTAEQVAEIRAKLIAQRPCDALTRAQYACALAAGDQAALYDCAADAP